MEIHLFQGFPYTTRKLPFPRLKLTLKGEESRKEGTEERSEEEGHFGSVPRSTWRGIKGVDDLLHGTKCISVLTF